MLIQGLVENPHVLLAGVSIASTVARNLVELSIRDHRGGNQVWSQILTKDVMPSLRRLSMHDITSYEDKYVGPVTGPGGMCMVTSMGTMLTRMYPPSEMHAVSFILDRIDLLDQLELLVSEDNARLEEIPSLVHLTLLRLTDNALLTTSEVLPSSKYVQVHFGDDPSEIDKVFESLSDLLDSNESQLEYLCFPSPFTLTASQSDIIDHLIEQQVEIVYDGDSHGLFIPPSFTDYLEKKETEQVVVEESS